MELKENKKNIINLTVCKDKVDECESILENYKKCEKQLAFYQEKYEDYSSTAKEIKILSENNSNQLKKIDSLNIELEKLQATNNDSFLRLKRLNRLEKEKIELEDKIKEINDDFQKLLNEKASLSYEMNNLSKKLKELEFDHKEKSEEHDYKKAILENELSSKEAERLRICEETSQRIEELEVALEDNKLKIEDLTEINTETETKLSELSKVHKQEHQENQTLKIDIEQMKTQLEQTESTLDSTKHELKKITKETNLKINELTKEREAMLTELKSAKETIETVKKNSELNLINLANQVSSASLFICCRETWKFMNPRILFSETWKF